MSAQPPRSTWIDEPEWVHPETDLGNAHRIRYHCSDLLRWDGKRWETYSRGAWGYSDSGALAHASQLSMWISTEAADLDAPDAARARLAWAIESQSCARIEAALKLARGFMDSSGRSTVDQLEYCDPTHREQCMAAMLAVVNEGDAELRAKDSGRIVATRLCARVEQQAERFWPASHSPPLELETIERIASAALNGKVTAAAGRAAKNSSARI
jgi:hypothetical protein